MATGTGEWLARNKDLLRIAAFLVYESVRQLWAAL